MSIIKSMASQKSILFMILSINLYQYAHTAKEVLNIGDELLSGNSSTNLVSSNGIFTLGFSTVQTINFTYLGIWYTNEIEDGMIIWVANRNKPVIGDGVLRIDESGALKVVNGDGVTLFNVFYNQEVGSGKNTTIRAAVLDDSGNFIVYDDANEILWKSFDHLTDKLIPGMKLGYNLTTKKNWTLTSSLSNDVMGSGAFTMKLEEYQNSPQLVIYRRGELYWASGPWNNNDGTFQYLTLDYDIHGSQIPVHLISDNSGMFIYTTGSDSSMLKLFPAGFFSSMIKLSSGGSLYVLAEMSLPLFCYGYGRNYDNEGCVISEFIKNCHGSYMWKNNVKGNFIPETVTYHDDNQSISIGDCMERCWNDCNCGGCATNVNGTGCITWTQQDNYKQINGGLSSDQNYVLFFYKPPKRKTWKWILVSLAAMLTIVLLAYLCSVKITRRRRGEKERRKRDDFIQELTSSDSFNFGEELEKGFKDVPDVKIFSLKAILTATNNFSADNKLGQGGYGPVYMGELFDGRKIAVKRLSKTSGQGILEFKSELVLISKLQHTNLVRLYGCCIHQEEKMLIYEFMPKKSLDFFLFAEDKKKEIDWKIRFNIVEGIAQGLLYLHKYSRMRIIHRDLKVSNILLDENMNPKIADFGMARIFQQNVKEEITKKIAGTYGYMAPEYAMQGTFSIKSDVFSFGVLILEIVSGKKNSSFYNYDMPLSLAGYAWELWKREAATELKDKALGESYDVKQLLRCIHVGLLCVQEKANDRPTMSEVIYLLNDENIDLPAPKKPAFFTQPNDVQSSNSTQHLSRRNIPISANSLTFSMMEAR